jgi:nitrite reductase/ring-hydroxylating ferredoxin subunit
MSAGPTLAASDLPPGSATVVQAHGRKVAVFNVGGRFYAVDDRCPHHGASLCRGRVSGTMLPSEPGEYRWGLEGRVVTCPQHAWQFDLETGESLFDPAKRVRAYAVEVRDGVVHIAKRSAQ